MLSKQILYLLKSKPLAVLVTIFTVGITGSLLIIVTRAASPSVATEAEIGSLTGSSKLVSSALSSGGSYVQFGAPAPPPPPTDTSFLKIYVGANQVTQPGAISQSAAVTLAPHIDEYVTNVGQLPASTAAAMKTANPKLRILMYMNTAYAQQNQGPQSGKYTTDLYQLNSSGQYLRSNGFGNWVMDLTKAGWQTDRVNTANNKVSKDSSGKSYGSSVDGVWLDLLGKAPTQSGYNYASDAAGNKVIGASTLPFNQATGQNCTAQEWMANTINIAKAVKTSINKLVDGNGLAQGSQYFAASGPTRQLLTSGLDDIMSEEFIRQENDGILVHSRSFTAWKQDVDMLVDAGKLGKRVSAMTKVWTTGTQAEKDAWHRFALSSFMLGTDGNSVFAFAYDQNWVTAHPYWDAARQVGSATGAYFTSGSLYERNYQSGLVVVNPTASPATLSLSRNYQTLDGSQVSTALVMPPYSGEVLKQR